MTVVEIAEATTTAVSKGEIENDVMWRDGVGLC